MIRPIGNLTFTYSISVNSDLFGSKLLAFSICRCNIQDHEAPSILLNIFRVWPNSLVYILSPSIYQPIHSLWRYPQFQFPLSVFLVVLQSTPSTTTLIHCQITDESPFVRRFTTLWYDACNGNLLYTVVQDKLHMEKKIWKSDSKKDDRQ